MVTRYYKITEIVAANRDEARTSCLKMGHLKND